MRRGPYIAHVPERNYSVFKKHPLSLLVHMSAQQINLHVQLNLHNLLLGKNCRERLNLCCRT